MQELERQLFTEKQKNEEDSLRIEQLRKDITQHEYVLKNYSSILAYTVKYYMKLL